MFSILATRFTLQKGDALGRFQAPSVAGRGFTITAKFDARAPGGVIVVRGGVAEGYTLFLDIARLGADRSLSLTLDGRVVAQGRASKLLSAQPLDGLNVGSDAAGVVGPYGTPLPFSRDIESVTIELEAPLD